MENKCRVIEIITPKKYLLNGLWFGGNKPKRAIIFIHGLTGSAFSGHKFITPLANENTAVITFSNRGHSKIARIKKLDERKKKGYTSENIGETHEVFTDCVDDIKGAVDFIKSQGVEKIYLAGHSTGCQKSIYYLSQKSRQKNIKGVILLCPVSDYSAITLFMKLKELKKIISIAKNLVRKGKPHSLLPINVWPHYHDAQRFLSLYTPDSKEEIFTYSQANKVPTTLQKVKIPILAIFAENDEYNDRPAKNIAEWFRQNLKSKNLTTSIINDAIHSFNKLENEVIEQISFWLNRKN